MRWSDPLVIVAIATGVGVLAILAIGLLVPQLPTLKQLLVGVKVDPLVVASCRLVLSAFGGTLVTLLTDALTTWQGTRLAATGVALTALINLAWGLVDRWLKRGQNAIDPRPVAGGGSPDLAKP